jgi:hypothetical protein
MFHASELSTYQETEVHGPNFTEPPPDLINDEEEYEIEAVLSHKGVGKCRRYLVSWKGYSTASNEWIPEENLANAERLLQAYKKTHRLD